MPLVSKAFVDRGHEILLGVSENSPAEITGEAAYAAPAPQPAPRPMPRPAQPTHAVAPAPVRVPEPPKSTSIFKSVFGFGGGAKNPAPAHPPHRQEPAIQQEMQAEPRPAVRPAQIDEVGLEIPAFLRRGP